MNLMKSKTAVRVHGPERKKLEGGQSPPRSTCVHFQSRSGTRACGGGAGRDRTGGLRLAKAALPQLSYSPVVEVKGFGGPKWIRTTDLTVISRAL